MRKDLQKQCANCKITFTVAIAAYLKRRTYCSRKCSAKATSVFQSGHTISKGVPKSESWKEKRRARKHTEEWKQNLSRMRTGSNNPHWNPHVGLDGLHTWVRSRLPKPALCQMCQKEPPRDLANKGIYDRELKNWEWLCRRCHMNSDGRMKKFVEAGGFRKKYA